MFILPEFFELTAHAHAHVLSLELTAQLLSIIYYLLLSAEFL